MTVEDLPGEPEEGSGLPAGVTEEQIHTLVDRIRQEAEHLGLYAADMPVVSHHEGHDHFVLTLTMQVGDLAFGKRVQRPEQDRADTAFREIMGRETGGMAEDIRERYRRKRDD